ncbi:hypothetical protein [Vulcaniibacterium tengchongense]|nr:hypothetical protein [Vulcaniibacterium tengchongense]
MPDRPGPGPVGPPQPDPALALDALGDRSGPADAAQPPAAGPPAPAAAEPTPEDAVQVVRDYYAAIDRGDYARAYALWSDGGRASDRTLEQFAQGFADTVSVEVEVMAPGPVDAGAGQRHIEVPVALTATHRDGGRHRFVGAYTLRRAVVDGATPEQRAWRIGSADLREVRP